MKKRLLAALLICGMMLLAACGSQDEVSKEKTIAYVNDHVEALSAFPYSEMPKYDDQAETAFIQEQLGADTIVKSVHRYDANILKFYCGGRGIVTSSLYAGFYYSADDTPYALEFDGEATFTETEQGHFEWKSDDNRKQITTERIQPNWFYYRMLWD